MPTSSCTTTHFFTVDVEEYFQVKALESVVSRDQWLTRPSRVARSVDMLLDTLAWHDTRATFFCLGWLANNRAEVVRSIVHAGHEIASHGFSHERVTALSRGAFRDEVRSSKRALEDVAGTAVLGFRAPSFSIVPGFEWALDVLIEEGYRYDSSLFPIRRPGYGYANGHRDPHWLERPIGRIAEVPPTTLRRWGANLPAGGGAYFRLLPYALGRAALRDCERRS